MASFEGPSAPVPVERSPQGESDATEEGVEVNANKERADALKNQGNLLFSDKKYHKAIDKYTESILLVPDAVYYSNRAQCHIKNEDFGLAITDATDAIRYSQA